MDALIHQGMTVNDLKPAHLRMLEEKALDHRDPFDHLISAQASAEQAIVVTDDAKLPEYGIRCIPA